MTTPPVMKRSVFLLLTLLAIHLNAQTNSETVTVPDQNFEQALVDQGIDTDGQVNSLVLRRDVESIEVLEVPNLQIKSLEGIQAFSKLKFLRAWNNFLTELDVSGNTQLVHLSVANNQITSLDLSANTAIVELFAYNNELSNLTIPPNDQLVHLSINNNQLTSLDISDNGALVDVYINDNNLSSVSLGNHPNLINFHAGRNSISSLDLTNAPSLKSLIVWGSNLSTIDLSSNFLIEELDINDNNLSSLDLSNNPNLRFAFCGSNNLTSLNIANGNNSGFISPEWSEYSFVASGNPNLACIQVDADMVEANRGDWGKDAGAIYSSDCASKPEYVAIPDFNFEQALIDFGIDTGIVNGWLLTSRTQNITNLNIPGRNISSLQGIEAFQDLRELHAYDNQIAALDVSANLQLVNLSLTNNRITSLDLSNNNLLEQVHVNRNNISSLTLGDQPNLWGIFAGGNELSSIDLTGLPALQHLTMWENNLQQLDLQNNPELRELFSDHNQLTSLDVSSNSKLETLFVLNNSLTSLNIANGNNANFVSPEWSEFSLVANANPDLFCIQVDPSMEGTNRADWGVDNQVIFSADCATVSTVYIPDTNFEQALIDLGIDSEGLINQRILRSDAEAVSGSLDVSLKGISDLTGIEAFVNITELRVGDNNLIDLDLSRNSNLTLVDAVGNNIDSVDISNLNDISTLRLGGNVGVDIITNLPQVTSLKHLNLHMCELTTFDASRFPNLELLFLGANHLSNIDVTKLSELNKIFLQFNNLKNIDFSSNQKLTQVVLKDNQLEDLNIQNGNNESLEVLIATNNNLTCITADSAIKPSASYTWDFDPGVLLSSDCGTLPEYVTIPDPNFEQSLIDIGVDRDRTVNSLLLRIDAESVTDLNLTNPQFVTGRDLRYANTSIENVNEKIQDLTGIEAFVNLTDLSVMSNALTNVDISNNILLEDLNLVDNQINSIDVSKNTKLKVLWLETNELQDVDVSANTELVNLALGYNKLTEIDVSNNAKLWALTIEGNDLITVDVSQNTLLGQIWVAENPNLTHMDFSKNKEMYGLGIYNTAIKTLDLSNNPITRLYFGNNPNLEHLDVRNGNNVNLNQFWADNTPNLTCINADAEISETMINSGKSFSEDCGDFIYIPDPNFEQALIDLGIDSDGVVNASLLREDAEATIDLDVSGRSIADLVGIESFLNLQKLKCIDNSLTQLDLINLKDLKELDVRRNPLSQIDVTNNEKLTLLYLSNTNIEEVDVSNNINLLYLAGSTTPITSVDVSNNINLEYFSFFNTPLTDVDFSHNPKLNTTYLIGNNLKTIDFSNNPELYAADISNNPNLKNVDMRNGNNLNVIYFNASNTPDLSCINADANISQAMIDSGKSFSEDCGDFIYIPDPNFEQALIDMGIDSDGVVNTSILKEHAEVVIDLNLNNPFFDNSAFANPNIVNVTRKIADLTGIEAFVNLITLQAAYGEITQVDLSANTQLEELFLNDNQLNSVDITMLPNLKRFGIMRNNMTSGIDVSHNPLLEELFVHNTGINSIDLSSNTNLWNLYIATNELTSLDLSANRNLKYLFAQYNQLAELDLSANTALIEVRCQTNQLSQLDITNLTALERLDAYNNPGFDLITGADGNPVLRSMNLSATGLSNFNGAAYPNLEWLLLNDNSLSNFNANNNLNLKNLFLNNNAITKLSLTGNTQLAHLQITNNGMEELDLRNANNAILGTVRATGNLLTCISVDDPADGLMPYASWELDLGVQLSLNCKQAEEVIVIADPNFEQALIDQGIDTNGENGMLTGNILLSEAEAVTSLIVNGSQITDATGIEGFVNLIDLDISDNLLTEINLLENSDLVSLDVSGNGLTKLYINSGKNLMDLQAENNSLEQLNIADFTGLQNLDVSGNSFHSIILNDLSNLVTVDVSGNELNKLDLRNGNNSGMEIMNATSNPLLECIGVDDNTNIPAGWIKDSNANYTNSGDCDAPVVQTQNITVSLDRYGLAEITPEDINNGSFDNVTAQRNLILELDITQFSCENIGENEVDLFVTDESGNRDSSSAIVTVLDEIVPNVSAVRSISLDLIGATFVALDPAELNDGSTDNCGNLEFAADRTSFSFPGNYTVEFSVFDGSGNTSSTMVDVEVTDSSKDITSLKFKKNLVATVYPNPFVDHFSIGFSKDIDLSAVDAKVFDMGSNLTDMKFVIDGNELKGEGILPVGEYFLRLTINGETQSTLISRAP